MRFICLDAYDVSLLGWPKDHPHYIMATKILADNNPSILHEKRREGEREGERGERREEGGGRRKERGSMK